MARGKWSTSIKDRAKAQYQADQIAAASTVATEEAHRHGYAAGYVAGYANGFEAGSRSARESETGPGAL